MSLASSKKVYIKNGLVIDRFFFAKFKKHKCFECEGKLKLIKITHSNIQKGTPEAEGKDIRYNIKGKPLDYYFLIFQCESCGKKLSISDQYFLENRIKKIKGKMTTIINTCNTSTNKTAPMNFNNTWKT